MLSFFPDLLTYGLLAPFIIRMALALYALSVAWKRGANATRQKDYSLIKWIQVLNAAIGGSLVLVGLATQIGAVILALWTLAELKFAKENRVVLIFALAMALSLLFSGAGFFAFDLPL